MATDDTGKIAVIRDLLNFEEKERKKKYGFVLDLDITSPLRTIGDLESAFDQIKNNVNAFNLYSVSPSHRNPYFNMVEYKDNIFIETSKKLPFDILSRQKAPKVFDVNASFYFYSKSFFESNLDTATTEKTMIYIVPHLCFDLDEIIDFEFMTYLIENKKLTFEI